MQGQDYVRVVIMAKISELLVQNMQCSSFPQEFDKWTLENKEISTEYATWLISDKSTSENKEIGTEHKSRLISKRVRQMDVKK